MMLPKTLFEEKSIRVKKNKVVSLEGFELKFDKHISGKAVTTDFEPHVEMINRIEISSPGQFYGELLYNTEHKHLYAFFNAFNKKWKSGTSNLKLFIQRAMMFPEYQLC